jgi:outer membrane beta-barrel protein
MAMKHVRVGLTVPPRSLPLRSLASWVGALLGAATLLSAPLTALAQGKAKKEEAREVNLDSEEKPEEETEGTAASGGEEEEEEEDSLPAICKLPGQEEVCASLRNFKALSERPLNPEMYAVQQIYALRQMRVELNPYFGVTLNDQFVSHPGPGLAANFYITNVIAVGLNGNFYQGLNSPSAFNFQTSRAARIGLPITEYQWNANANFTYVPAYGKYAGFSDFIFHYDFYLVGGVGAISTRPIAVVDPDNRSFEFQPKVSFNLGMGLRIFFNRWFAFDLELRDYLFFDELENPTIAAGLYSGSDAACQGRAAAQCPSTWKASESFTNNVQAQVGFSVFLPPSWEYKRPK